MGQPASWRRRALLASGASTLLPWSASRAQPTASVVNIATVGDPSALDPMPFTADLVSEIDQHIHETLYIFDPGLRFFPLLAAAIPEISADGTRYIIKLRTGVWFHDSTVMEADDVNIAASLDAPVAARAIGR